MGNLKTKVESLIAENFTNSQTELEEVPQLEKLSGLVAWQGFTGKTARQRQQELWNVLRRTLKPNEATALSIILTLTPDELRAYRNES